MNRHTHAHCSACASYMQTFSFAEGRRRTAFPHCTCLLPTPLVGGLLCLSTMRWTGDGREERVPCCTPHTRARQVPASVRLGKAGRTGKKKPNLSLSTAHISPDISGQDRDRDRTGTGQNKNLLCALPCCLYQSAGTWRRPTPQPPHAPLSLPCLSIPLPKQTSSAERDVFGSPFLHLCGLSSDTFHSQCRHHLHCTATTIFRPLGGGEKKARPSRPTLPRGESSSTLAGGRPLYLSSVVLIIIWIELFPACTHYHHLPSCPQWPASPFGTFFFQQCNI